VNHLTIPTTGQTTDAEQWSDSLIEERI